MYNSNDREVAIMSSDNAAHANDDIATEFQLIAALLDPWPYQ